MTTQAVTLVRHAKSSWQTAGQPDHDRPLNHRGLRDAPDMAQRLLDRSCIPDLILCSSAHRAVQTAHALQSAFKLADGRIRIDPKLYLASPQTLLHRLAKTERTVKHIMVVAHNPGLENLSELLANEALPPMPTMAVRHFGCSCIRALYSLFFSAAMSQPFPELDTHKSISQSTNHKNNQTAQPARLIFQDFPKNLG